MSEIKYTVNDSQHKEVSIPCLNCHAKSKHKVRVSFDGYGSDDEMNWASKYQVVQCLGCDSVSFRHESYNSEEYEQTGEDDYREIVHETLYPSRLLGRKGLGDDTRYLPDTVCLIYDETLAALINNSPVLTGIGLRALLETICKEKNAVGNDLYKKIDGLVAANILTSTRADILHKIRTLGNAAAHEVKPHNASQLGLALDVIEHLLKEVYILPKQVKSKLMD